MEPSFRRLFTHATWDRYTGVSTNERWLRCLGNWGRSSVLRSVWPAVIAISVWSSFIALAFPSGILLARASSMALPLSLQGSAIGLLLVFRTNNAYSRLEEARDTWSKLVCTSREVVSKCAVSLDYPVVCEVCRYLCALTWSLRDKLRDSKERVDILSTLLDKENCEWVLSQRSQPFALLTRIRYLLYDEFAAGRMPSHVSTPPAPRESRSISGGRLGPNPILRYCRCSQIKRLRSLSLSHSLCLCVLCVCACLACGQVHYITEMDLNVIDHMLSTCERLFTSPIPPNMARHGMRCLMLWLLALPVTLAGSVPPLLIVLWTAATSFIFLGIDELGAQVEQPFKIMPLWQVCVAVCPPTNRPAVLPCELPSLP